MQVLLAGCNNSTTIHKFTTVNELKADTTYLMVTMLCPVIILYEPYFCNILTKKRDSENTIATYHNL